jgi:hypothetical protein
VRSRAWISPERTRGLDESDELAQSAWFPSMESQFPATKRESWTAKLRRNIERDAEVNAALEAQGWHVVRVWESEEHTDLDRAVARVVKAWERQAGASTVVSRAPGETCPPVRPARRVAGHCLYVAGAEIGPRSYVLGNYLRRQASSKIAARAIEIGSIIGTPNVGLCALRASSPEGGRADLLLYIQGWSSRR